MQTPEDGMGWGIEEAACYRHQISDYILYIYLHRMKNFRSDI